MRECQGCGETFEETRWWQTFHSKECQQAFHKRRYRAEAIVAGKLNGHDPGTRAEEREAARQALAAWAQSLSAAEPLLKRRL